MNCYKIGICYKQPETGLQYAISLAWRVHMVWVVGAELRDAYKVFVEFNDGTIGVIDFEEKLRTDRRQIMRYLLDLDTFKTVKVDLDTLCWDNGVDFAPEYLYEKITEKKKSHNILDSVDWKMSVKEKHLI
jgi:hypothetical protein